MQMAYGLNKEDMQAIFNERKVTPSDFKQRSDMEELKRVNPEAAKYVEEFYKQYFIGEAVSEIVDQTSKLNELTEIDAKYKISFYDMLYDFNNNPELSPETMQAIRTNGEELVGKLEDLIYNIGKPYQQELELMDSNPQTKYLYLELLESKRGLKKALNKIK
jgi:hypothetical protein